MKEILLPFVNEIITAAATMLFAYIKMKLDKKKIRKRLLRYGVNGNADDIIR